MPTATSRACMYRLSLAAGLVAAVQMIVVTLVDGGTRPGYDPWRQWVSHLALGERGWLGVSSLIVCGLLLVGYAFALRRGLPPGRGARWASKLVLLAGIALVVGGVFRIDPGLGYPPGVAASHSASGSVHDLAGGVVFAGLIGAAALLGRALGGHRTRAALIGYLVAAVVATSFVACSLLAALDYAGVLPGAPSGLLERVALFAGLGWLGAVSVHLLVFEHNVTLTKRVGDGRARRD